MTRDVDIVDAQAARARRLARRTLLEAEELRLLVESVHDSPSVAVWIQSFFQICFGVCVQCATGPANTVADMNSVAKELLAILLGPRVPRLAEALSHGVTTTAVYDHLYWV